MELSRFSDLHFIQAAQGGLLVRTLNVTSGKPVLKFKKLTDITDDIEGLVFDSCGVKVEKPSMSSGGKGIIKSDPEASEFSCSGSGNNGRNSVMEDFDFGYMTLKQLKERCKEKKRKQSECIDLNRETDINCSCVKQEYPNVESDEDELDLMDPLCSWKSKLAKNKKAKSECLKKRVFSPLRSASSVIKSVDIPCLQDFLHSKADLSAPIDIKKEVLELVDCSEYENSSSLICDNQLGSCQIVAKEVPEVAAECNLGSQAEDPQICVVNEAYYEYMDNCSTDIISACGDIKKVDDPEIISHNLYGSESKGEEYVTHPICDDVFQESFSSTNDHSFGVHDGHRSFSINHEMQWQIDSDGIVHVPDMTNNNFDHFVEASGSDACSLEDDCRGDLPSNLETNALHSVSDCSVGSNRCLVSSVGDSPVAEEKKSQRFDCDDVERNCFLEILHHDASEEFTTTVGDDDGLRLPERFFPTRMANNMQKVDDAERIIQEKEVPEIAAECNLGTGTEDPQIYVVNEAYCEYMDNCSTESVHIVTASCRDIEKVADSEIISHNLSVSEREEEYVTHPICDDPFEEPISLTNDHSFGMHDGHQSFSINHEMQCQIDSDRIVQVPDMITNNFDQFMEASGSVACSHEDDSRDGLPSNLEINALHGSVGNCSLGSNHCLVSSAGDSPVAEEKESQRSDCGVDVEGNCFSEILYHDASKECTTTVDVGFDDSSEPKCPPKRLFPTRKAISPSSQEKLCKAMESYELHDEEHYGGNMKLCFAKETENKTKIHRTEGLDQVRRIRYSIKPKHIVMKKTKDEKRNTRHKGIPKVPNISPAVPHISNECASIQWCSHSAIAFSERQMQDIECLATTLRNELKTMKEIVEERLWSEETYPATSLKYDTSKVRRAINNVTRAEQSAQKWISMMARDCSRFCKIMKLTETGSVTSKSVVNKVRKKVTFADEAGEKLCHVRIF